MQTILVDSLVLNTIQAAAADTALAKGVITFNGMGTAIPIRKVLAANAYRKTVAAAGTPKAMTFTIGNVPDSSTNYTLTITKFPVVSPGLQQGNALYSTTENYAVITDATALASELGILFSAAITTAIAAGRSGLATATDNGAGVLTLTAATANFDFLISMSPNTNTAGLTLGTQAVSTALVETSGTYAQVYAINTNATSGSTYDEFSYRWYPDLGDDVLKQGQNQEQCFEVRVFLKVGAANLAALETELAANAAGTSTASKYLGF